MKGGRVVASYIKAYSVAIKQPSSMFAASKWDKRWKVNMVLGTKFLRNVNDGERNDLINNISSLIPNCVTLQYISYEYYLNGI